MNLIIALASAATFFEVPAETPAETPLAVESVLITLLDKVEVPAPEPGVLSIVAVKVGDKVKVRTPLARIDDTRVKLKRDQAKLDLVNAQRLAGNDLKVQIARKQHELAQQELKRVSGAAERVANSVSQTQIDRLTLDAEKAALDIDQANFEFETAQMTVQAKENELRIAEHDLIRHTIFSPLAGVVVDVYKQQGEWVEGGRSIARIIRMDKVRAEGFIDAARATDKIVGHSAKVVVSFGEEQVEFTGQVTFVSPEIHPVTGKVRIWAEIENRDGRLRPGLPAKMTIAP